MTRFQVRKNFNAQSDKVCTEYEFISLQEFDEVDIDSMLLGCSAEFGGDYHLIKEVDYLCDAMDFIKNNDGIYWTLECYKEGEELPAITFELTKIK